MARPEKKEKRVNVASMIIEVEHKEVTHSIEMLRPIDARDGLWVKYDADTMGVVVDILRCSGWKDPQPQEPTGVKGVYKRKGVKGFFIVHLRTVCQSGPKYKKVKNMEEAAAVLSERGQQPEPDALEKADEESAEASNEPVETHVEQSTAQSSCQDDGANDEFTTYA